MSGHECTCPGHINVPGHSRRYCRGCFEAAKTHAFIKGIVACARNAGHDDETVRQIVRSICGVEGISTVNVALDPEVKP